MKRALILLSLLGPCNNTENEDVMPASSALDSSDDLRRIKDAGPDVSAPVCQVPEAAAPPPPPEPERFVELCLPGKEAYFAQHTFPDMANIAIEARVSALCIRNASFMQDAPDFDFETLKYMMVENHTMRVACGYINDVAPHQSCSQVVFYVRPQ